MLQVCLQLTNIVHIRKTAKNILRLSKYKLLCLIKKQYLLSSQQIDLALFVIREIEY